MRLSSKGSENALFDLFKILANILSVGIWRLGKAVWLRSNRDDSLCGDRNPRSTWHMSLLSFLRHARNHSTLYAFVWTYRSTQQVIRGENSPCEEPWDILRTYLTRDARVSCSFLHAFEFTRSRMTRTRTHVSDLTTNANAFSLRDECLSSNSDFIDESCSFCWN